MNQRGFSLILLIVGGLVLGVVVVIIVLFQNQLGSLFKTKPKPSVQPVATSTPAPRSDPFAGSLYLYTISGNNLSQIEVFPNFTVNEVVTHPPVAGPDGTVFINNSQEVDQYNLETKIKTKLLSADKDYLFDEVNFQQPDTLFISELPNNTYGALNPPILIERNLTTNTDRLFSSVPRVVSGSLDYLFKDSQGDNIIGSFGMDGCNGYGVIYKVSGTRPNLVTKTGGKCNRDSLYIGSFVKKDSLVMMSYSGDYKESGGETYDTLYLQSALDNDKRTLLDLKAQNKSISSFVYNQEKNKIAFFYQDGLHIYDIESATQTGQISLNEDVNSFYEWKGDYGIGYFNDTKTMWIVTLPSGGVKKYQVPSQFGPNITPHILGTWKGQPLISITQTP